MISIGVALAEREHRRDQRDDQQQSQNGHAATGQAPGPAVLADVLAFELVLGHPVHGRGQIGHRGPEATVAQIEIGLVPGPAQVQVAGFVEQRPSQGVGHGRGLRR